MRTFKTVKRGSTGTDVIVLQTVLRMMQYTGADGEPIKIDGECGNNLVFAINEFQQKQRAYGYECGTNGKNDSTFGSACWARILGT